MDKTDLTLTRAHLFIEGRVQGVGFRYFTKNNAQDMDLKGWVKNLSDGRVEAVFEGPKAKVMTMIEKCQSGPRAGRVENIDLQWEETDNELQGFQVKYA